MQGRACSHSEALHTRHSARVNRGIDARPTWTGSTMLEALRRGAGTWIARVLLGILAISFSFWGIPEFFRARTDGPIATVGSAKITAEQFQQAYGQELDQVSRQYRQRITPQVGQQLGLDRRTLANLIGTTALDEQAKELGLALPDSLIADGIRNDPNFRGFDGKFSKAAFDGFLRQTSLSEKAYFALRRQEEIRGQLTDAVLVNAGTVPQAHLDLVYKWREETRIVEHVTIDPAKVVTVVEPDDAKLTAYYDSNKSRFMQPEFRKASVLLLTRDEMLKRVPVTDAEVSAAYDADKSKFDLPEKRRVFQLAFPDAAAAGKAYEELSKAANFVEAATKLGFKDSDIDLGVVTRKDMIDTKAATAAFALKKDELSKPVAADFTTVLLRVTEIEAGRVKPLDEVKGEIKDRLASERVSREISVLHDKVDDLRSSGKSLKEAGATHQLTYKEVDAIDQSGKALDGKTALDHPEAARIALGLFATQQGLESEAIQLGDGGYAWVDVLGITPSRQKTLDDVKAEAKTLWLAEDKQRQIIEAASKFVERVTKGESLDAIATELGAKVEKTTAFTRTTSPQGLSTAAVQAAFARPKGGVQASASVDGASRAIIRVADVIAAPAATQEQTDKLKSELSREFQAEQLNAYVQGLQTRLGTTLNAAALGQALGITPQQQ
jgi:peptidyl-prolyl cis-trans isomerase D